MSIGIEKVPMGIFLTSKVRESQVGDGVVGKSDWSCEIMVGGMALYGKDRD